MRRALLIAVVCATLGCKPRPATLPLDAVATCGHTANSCSAAAAPAVSAGYRKDFFYPYSVYPEASIPDPTNGGRVQIAATAQVSGTIEHVLLNGVDLTTLYGDGGLDWYHAWPNPTQVGAPLWIAFHSHSPTLDQLAQATVTVQTDAGDALNAVFPIQTTPVELTSVSLNVALDTVLAHVKNSDTKSHTLSKLFVNGLDVTDVACIPMKTLEPAATMLVTVPLCAATAPGAAWTVALESADAPVAVGVGRVVPPFYPIETWPPVDNCPFPDESNDSFEAHLQHGFDTFFVQNGFPCNVTDGNDILQSFADTPNVFSMPDVELTLPNASNPHVAARFCGDEADVNLSNAASIQQCADGFWAETPSLPTYVGGSRNRYSGAFAGTTDIQGMDFYVCDCAPHVTDFGNFPPFRGAYDYAVAARRNQAPLPTWTYTQGFSGVWDVAANPSTEHRQLTPAEMRAEAMSVIASGTKGLMYFQTELNEAALFPESWAALGAFNADLRSVRDVLRDGAATGGASADAQTIVEAIRGPDAIVVPAVSLVFVDNFAAPAESATNDVYCGIGENLHWQWAPHTTDIQVQVPEDLGVVDVFEVLAGTLQPVTTSVHGRQVTLHAVSMNEEVPARLFVLASSAAVRARVTASFQ
jgi:hypothetical protein